MKYVFRTLNSSSEITENKQTSLNSWICDWLKRAKTFPIFFLGSSRFVPGSLSSSSAAGAAAAAASSAAAGGGASSFSFSFVFSFFSFLSLSLACFTAQCSNAAKCSTTRHTYGSFPRSIKSSSSYLYFHFFLICIMVAFVISLFSFFSYLYYGCVCQLFNKREMMMMPVVTETAAIALFSQ